ncbi:MAG: hypothetical protein U1E76_12655 [Planctomycetota bacterium]
MPRSLVTLVVLLTIALFLTRARPWALLDTLSASLSLVHWPGLVLADLAGLRPELARGLPLSQADIDAVLAAAESAAAELNDAAASVSFDDPGPQVIGLGPDQCAALEPGRPVAAGGALVGFAVPNRERQAFVPLTAAKLLLRVEIDAGAGDRVRAVLGGDRAQDPRLLYPELRAPLCAGQFVRTAAGEAFLPGGTRVLVPAGLQVGWLAEDLAKGTIRHFRVRLVRSPTDGLSVVVLGVTAEGSFVARRQAQFASQPVLLRGPLGGLAQRVEFLALAPTLGGRVCRGAAACGPWFFGQIAQAGPGAARVAFSGSEDDAVAVLVAGSGPPRPAWVRLVSASRFELLGDGTAPVAGEWLLTSGTQLSVPPGLLVGRVRSIDQQGRTGVLERPAAPDQPARLLLVRHS